MQRTAVNILLLLGVLINRQCLAGRCLVIGLVFSALAGMARGEVVRLQIDRREPFAGGHGFGKVGPYEKITGRLFFEVSPDDPANGRVVDLKLAPTNGRGRVEFWSDFFLLKPADPARGNRRLFYDGNEVAGIRLPEVAVPIATYTGWNLRAARYGAEGMLGRWTGSYFPFCRTADERTQSSDPRPAALERYPTQQDYLARVADAADRLERQGYLLEEDAQAIRRRAAQRKLWESK